MTKKYGATLGKRAVGVEVRSDNSESLSWGQVILRETIGKIVSMIILYIGYIMAAFTKRKQALHDKIASTVVIHKDPNKKFPVWAIIVIIILPVVMIIGILATIVLVSLSSARNKASDAGAKAAISSVIPDALLYADSNKGTLIGYDPAASFSSLQPCSGKPIVGISSDGKNIAVFVKSCVDSGKYFCDDLNAKIIEVDGSYATSGKTDCGNGGQTTGQNISVSDSSTPAITRTVDANGLYVNVADDLAMLNAAAETAKGWQADAQAYYVIMLQEKLTGGKHALVFKSKNAPGKMFVVALDKDANVVSSSEADDAFPDTGYISIDSLKISSAQAIQTSVDFLKKSGKTISNDNYSIMFSMSYSKAAKGNIWTYVADNKTTKEEAAVVVDAATGRVLDSKLK